MYDSSMAKKDIAPSDTRYIALTQQKYCCVPVCIQMVMLRHGIPLVQAEELAYHLGLGVTEKEKDLFWNPRVIEKLPEGFSIPTTRISKPEYNPNKVFENLGIPLKFSQTLIDKFDNFKDFNAYLQKFDKEDIDALVCFDWEFVSEEFTEYMGGYGHVCVLDKISQNEIRAVDPEYGYPKWPIIKIKTLYGAMKSHGAKRGGGFWELEYIGGEK